MSKLPTPEDWVRDTFRCDDMACKTDALCPVCTDNIVALAAYARQVAEAQREACGQTLDGTARECREQASKEVALIAARLIRATPLVTEDA